MTFQLARRTRNVLLMMPVGPESGSGNVPPTDSGMGGGTGGGSHGSRRVPSKHG
jgi:hypothetical protein